MKLSRFLTALLMCVMIFSCHAALGETADEEIFPVTIVELTEMLWAPDEAALAGKMIRVQAYFGGTFDDGTGNVYGFLILGNPNSCCADSIRFIPAETCVEFPDMNAPVTLTGRLVRTESNGFSGLRIVDAELDRE